jgi:hypothetical protein
MSSEGEQMRTAQRALAAATVTLVALGAAACGDSGKSDDKGSDTTASANEDFVALSADEIKTEVIADMKALESMTMTADIASGDQQIGLDLALDTDGTCVGTMTIGDGTAQIMSVDGSSYLKGDTAFWESSGGEGSGKVMEEMVGDRWAKLPGGQGGFESFCDLDGLLDEFGGSDASSATVEKGEEGEVDGQPALKLTSDEDGGTTSLWVATSGEDHFILKIERSGNDGGDITLSGFNEPVDATAPSDEDVVDLGALG